VTTERLTDINDGALNSSPEGFAYYNGGVYFSAYQESSERELWAYDGIASRIKDINPGSSSSMGVSSSKMQMFYA
jgi:ELWxxDGT repeat protein